MDKLAQKRRLNLLNRIREDSNISGKMLEYKNQDFEIFMDKLRGVDERVRELVVSEAGEHQLKDHLKVAKSNFNRREYVNTVIILGRYHEILAKIAAEFKSLEIDQGKIHNKFLFDGLSEDQKKFLMEEMPKTFKKKPPVVKASIVTDVFIKEAGISDIFHNFTTDRGRALKAWEKRFPKFAKEFKRETEKILSKTEGLYNALTGTLKSIGILRAQRKPEEYLAVSGAFVKKFEIFHNEFGAYYDEYVNQLVETQKSIDTELPKVTPAVMPDLASEPGLKDFMKTPDAPAPGASPPGVSPPAAVTPLPAAVVPGTSPTPEKKDTPATRENVGAGTVMSFPPGSNAPNSAQQKRMTVLENLVLKDFMKIPDAPAPGASPPGSNAPNSAQQKRMTVLENSVKQTEPSGSAEQTEKTDQSEKAKAEESRIVSGLKGIIESKKEQFPETKRSPGGKTANLKHKKVIEEYVPDTLRDGEPSFEDEAPDTLADFNFPEDDFVPKAPKLPLEFEEMVNRDQQEYERALRLIEQRENQKIEQEMPTFAPPKNAEQFLAELDSFAGENSLVFASRIVRFANSIAKSDKETSDKLLSIAKSLLSKI